MAQSFDDNLHIVEESDIDPTLLAALAFPDDLNVIQGLDDEPNDVGGLTAAELKAKFDQAGLTIQRYINETLIPEVVAADATETARSKAEEARETAEEERIRAEAERVKQETSREEAEKARVEAETARVKAEEERTDAEKARSEAEEARKTAERDRDTAEAGRRDAEAERVSETKGVVALARQEADRAEAAAGQSASAAQTVGSEATRAGAEADRAEAAAKAAAQARVEAEAVAGGDFSYMLERHNADPEAHGIRRRVIRTRVRDPDKPTYGLEGGEEDNDQVTLRVSAYTGGAEVSAEINGVMYDADNMSANGDTAPDGTLIIEKTGE